MWIKEEGQKTVENGFLYQGESTETRVVENHVMELKRGRI
jgi:hypothetical protein